MHTQTDAGIRQESSARDLVRVPKHTGAIVGLLSIIGGIIATSIFCSWFATGRIKEVNGPAASGIMIFVALIIVGFAAYESRIVIVPQKFNFYKGMMVSTSISGVLAGACMFGTMLYRDQSGGQTLSGQEAMLILGALVSICLFAEVVATRNLGGLKRKQKAAQDG